MVMKPAVELFTFERRSPSSSMIEQTWQTRSVPAESFISVAVTHWEMVVTRQRGTATLTVRGPETKATPATIPSGAEDGSRWELPGPGTADVFVDTLVRAGLLVHDPVAAAALRGDVDGLSARSVERRVSRATGLTRGAITRIRRAERAVDLLSRGVSPADVSRQAGYADQPHLTRSLKRLMGRTPSQITMSGHDE